MDYYVRDFLANDICGVRSMSTDVSGRGTEVCNF